MSNDTYFDKRDMRNAAILQQILDEDLPDFCSEYFVGISSRTT